MNDPCRVVIVEDHALLRAGLLALLERDTEIAVVGEADNGRDALRVAAQSAPDLVLLDITMPGTNGIDVIGDLKRRHPGLKVLVLTIHKSDDYIQGSLNAGADGYLLKGATPDELRQAIRTVMSGKCYLSPEISQHVVHGYLGGGKTGVTTAWDRLTQRERQVLKLIAEGHPNKSIAEYLCLSVKTVEKHRSNLMSKLDIHNASTLTGFAIQKGLLAN